MSTPLEIKIAYIGGGSRECARKLMIELALRLDLSGQVVLYDIDLESAKLNEQLGTWLHHQPHVVSHWRYTAVETLNKALNGADLVAISIQPGTLEVMAEEIAIAEQYGMFFPVGDSTGAPGLVRGDDLLRLRPRHRRSLPQSIGDQLHQPHDHLHPHIVSG